MKQSAYEIEAAIESTHWWFAGRRRLFARMIEGLRLARDARILDVGTSTGTNLRMLGELGFTRFEGIDSSDDAARWCEAKGLGHVTRGDAGCLPFADESFDLVLATDVIEHVDDDGAALREITRVLKRGGRALITVPAFRSLWGLQDEISQHKRRYRAREVLALVRGAGLQVLERFYFNYVLFVPIFLARQAMRLWRPRIASENQVNSPFVNRALGAIFRFDVRTAPRLRPPFGVSYLVLAGRDGDGVVRS
jgi:SAM-dependent methyltransferase